MCFTIVEEVIPLITVDPLFPLCLVYLIFSFLPSEILSSKKKQRKDLTKTINMTKQEIDEKRQTIERLRQEKQEHGKHSSDALRKIITKT